MGDFQGQHRWNEVPFFVGTMGVRMLTLNPEGGAMNAKRFWIAAAVVFVAMAVLEFIFNGIIMSKTYQETSDFWRSTEDMQSKMFLMYIGYAIYAIMFTFIFTKGYEGKGIAEGLRYGAYVWALVNLASAFVIYAVMPWPGKIEVSMTIFHLIENLILGVLVSVLYKPAVARAPAAA